MHLFPCARCRRHVRRTETRCPFCAGPIALEGTPVRRSPTQRLGRAAIAAFGAAAVSTSFAACGARGGLVLDLGPRASEPMDGGSDAASFAAADAQASTDASRGDAAFARDAALARDAAADPDTGELTLPAYGGPWFDPDAGTDAACADPGCASADYGGPPWP